MKLYTTMSCNNCPSNEDFIGYVAIGDSSTGFVEVLVGSGGGVCGGGGVLYLAHDLRLVKSHAFEVRVV